MDLISYKLLKFWNFKIIAKEEINNPFIKIKRFWYNVKNPLNNEHNQNLLNRILAILFNNLNGIRANLIALESSKVVTFRFCETHSNS